MKVGFFIHCVDLVKCNKQQIRFWLAFVGYGSYFFCFSSVTANVSNNYVPRNTCGMRILILSDSFNCSWIIYCTRTFQYLTGTLNKNLDIFLTAWTISHFYHSWLYFEFNFDLVLKVMQKIMDVHTKCHYCKILVEWNLTIK